MDEQIGNPQATPTELAWLAGIWDGEGTFSINKGGASRRYWCPRMTLGNTSKEMIDEIVRVMRKCGVNPSVCSKKTYNAARHAPSWNLNVNKQSQVKVMADALIPYLINKKLHALAISELTGLRIESQKTRKGIWSPETKRLVGSTTGITGGYSEREVELSNYVLSLNRKFHQRGAPETERTTLEWQAKIQSELLRKLQKTEETAVSPILRVRQ